MPTLVKIRGLDRSNVGGYPGVGSGFRLRSAFKQKTGGTGVVKATRTSTGTTDNLFRVTSRYGGATFNGIGLTVNAPAGSTTTVTAAVQSDGLPNIVVSPKTGATANEVVAAINANPDAAQWVTADVPSGTGAAAVVATAAGDLTTGADGTGSSDSDILLMVRSTNSTVVDLDDVLTMKLLRRNAGRYISLGQP